MFSSVVRRCRRFCRRYWSHLTGFTCTFLVLVVLINNDNLSFTEREDSWQEIFSSNRLPKEYRGHFTPLRKTLEIPGCDITSGVTELKQLLRYITELLEIPNANNYDLNKLLDIMEMSPEIISLFNFTAPGKMSPDEFQYHFGEPYLKQRCKADQVCLEVNETKNNVLHTGGTAFLIETYVKQPQELGSMCSFDDYFNGTYTICCDVLSSTQTMNITRAFVDYAAFQGHPTKGRIIYLENVQVNHLYDIATVHPRRDIHEAINYSSYWMKATDTRWRWYKDGTVLKDYSHLDLRTCIKERFNGRTTIIGDSHVRGIHSYITSTLGWRLLPTLADRHTNRRWNHHKFIWAPYPEDVIESLKTLKRIMLSTTKSAITKVVPKKPLFLLLDTGAHTLHTEGIIPLLLHIRGVVQELMRFIMATAPHADITVIWLDMPSSADYYSTHYDPMHWRNQFSSSAINKWLCDALSLLGVRCLPYNEMSAFWRNSPVCLGHYLCVCPTRSIGQAGLGIVNQLLSFACHNMQT